MDIAVNVDDLRACAVKAREAAENTGEIHVVEGPELIARAMPESGSADAAAALRGTWSEEHDDLVKAMDDYGDNLDAAADEYDSNDDIASATLEDIAGGLTGGGS